MFFGIALFLFFYLLIAGCFVAITFGDMAKITNRKKYWIRLLGSIFWPISIIVFGILLAQEIIVDTFKWLPKSTVLKNLRNYPPKNQEANGDK